MNPLNEIKLKRAILDIESNLDMAARFPHIPALEQKFLAQAIKAEEEVNRLKEHDHD